MIAYAETLIPVHRVTVDRTSKGYSIMTVWTPHHLSPYDTALSQGGARCRGLTAWAILGGIGACS